MMIKKIIKQVAENQHSYTVRMFLYCIYMWVIANTLILLPQHAAFWGPESFIPVLSETLDGAWYNIFYLLRTDLLKSYYWVFVIGQLIAAIFALFRIDAWWPRILILFFTYNLDERAFLIQDGGNNLVHLLLFYALFMATKPSKSVLKNTLSNMAVLIARVQVVLVYFVAGLAKVTGEQWQEGMALFYTLSVDEYTLPFLKGLLMEYYPFSVLGSYFTVLFQLSFPWLVWFKQTRPWMLAIGTFLHLQISFVMGLLMFGLAMIVGYTIFNTEQRAKKILNFLEKWRPYVLSQRKEPV